MHRSVFLPTIVMHKDTLYYIQDSLFSSAIELLPCSSNARGESSSAGTPPENIQPYYSYHLHIGLIFNKIMWSYLIGRKKKLKQFTIQTRKYVVKNKIDTWHCNNTTHSLNLYLIFVFKVNQFNLIFVELDLKMFGHPLVLFSKAFQHHHYFHFRRLLTKKKKKMQSSSA